MELDKLYNDGRQFRTYTMQVDAVKKSDIVTYKKHCTAPEVLDICEGAQVMLIYNIDTCAGLANGSRGVVTGFINDFPLVKFLNGAEKVIDYFTWKVEKDDEIVMTIKQVPLKVAYAITIHKMQGSTLDYAEIDLSEIFASGQAYVALSRVKSLNGLSIIDKEIDFGMIKANPRAMQFYKRYTHSRDT